MTYLLLMSVLIFQTGIHSLHNYRTVLIFGNNQTLLQQQLQTLQKDSSGLVERDVILKLVKPGDHLYKLHQVVSAEPFTVILIGKDGGEKYRSASILTTGKLFATIDAMPMQQAEMQRAKNKQ